MALENRPFLMSYADFLALPAESPGELVDGELIVGPSPRFRHQRVVIKLVVCLEQFLELHPELGEVCVAPIDVVLKRERPAIVLQPDVLFISAERQGIIQEVVMGAPDLVVEVISPGSQTLDLGKKLDYYARYGVREYWLVWPDEERVEVYLATGTGTFGPKAVYGPDDTLKTHLLPGFTLSIARILAKRPGP